jgi:hypothetical protein
MAEAPLMPVTREAGMFLLPDGRKVKIADTRYGAVWDTVAQPAGAVTAGTELVFFENLQNKRMIDTSLNTNGRIPAGTELILESVGLYILSAFGSLTPAPGDVKQFVDAAYLNFRINGITQQDGPAVHFHSGLGFAGNTNESGQGIISLGVAATGSVRLLDIPQLITKDHDIRAVLRFDDRIWAGTAPQPGAVFETSAERMPDLSTAVAARIVLQGQLIVASTK